jgi:large subunit ribosomal protein L4
MAEQILPIYNTEGKETGTMKLDAAVFDGEVNTAAIYQAVNAWRANQRKGLAATKTRGEVSGGGKKPWKQKGTGRARAGSTRSPLWRHGGVIFGPHPRDFSWRIPERIKRLALRSSLNAKLKDSGIVVLDEVKLGSRKTKEAARIFANLKMEGQMRRHKALLFLAHKIDRDLRLSLRNLGFLTANLAKDTNVYEVLAHRKVVITKDGLQELTERLR